mmetsp:Transcript_4828/g.7321  ORF Transcript_4828/g.7321 Transcript_4828/m.7321 type:complete len:98 (-) Transcript_4828:260-553(-)
MDPLGQLEGEFVGAVVGVGVPLMTQGRTPKVQDNVIEPVQQAISPPGRLSHPSPPQSPHAEGQHLVPEESAMLPGGQFDDGAVVGVVVGVPLITQGR